MLLRDKSTQIKEHPSWEVSINIPNFLFFHSFTFVYTRLHLSRLVYNRVDSSSDSSTLVYTHLDSSSVLSVFLEQILKCCYFDLQLPTWDLIVILFYVKKYFRTYYSQKLMTLSINQVLFSFEMTKYARYTEINMIMTIAKAQLLRNMCYPSSKFCNSYLLKNFTFINEEAAVWRCSVERCF